MIKAPRPGKGARVPKSARVLARLSGIVYVQTYSGRNIGGRRVLPRINREFSRAVLFRFLSRSSPARRLRIFLAFNFSFIFHYVSLTAVEKEKVFMNAYRELQDAT